LIKQNPQYRDDALAAGLIPTLIDLHHNESLRSYKLHQVFYFCRNQCQNMTVLILIHVTKTHFSVTLMTVHQNGDFNDNLSYPSFELLCEGIETIITATTNIAGRSDVDWYDFDDLYHSFSTLSNTPHYNTTQMMVKIIHCLNIVVR
jgi:hypothetical protein